MNFLNSKQATQNLSKKAFRQILDLPSRGGTRLPAPKNKVFWRSPPHAGMSPACNSELSKKKLLFSTTLYCAFFFAAVLTACSGVGSNASNREQGRPAVRSPDAGGEVTPSADGGRAGEPDAGGFVVAESTCRPIDLSSYTPAAAHKNKPFHSGDCSVDDLQNFSDRCLGRETAVLSAACVSWRAANQRCEKCLLAPEASGSDPAVEQGPIVANALGELDVNLQGCIDSVGAGCGALQLAWDQCSEVSCSTEPGGNCAGLRETSPKYQACMSAAKSGGCAKYRTVLQSTCPSDSASEESYMAGISRCYIKSFAWADQRATYMVYAELFCGAEAALPVAVPPDADGGIVDGGATAE